MGRLAGRLSAARHRGFIGRTAERALFAAALAAAEPPFQVLYVVGPGGVGKTALLEEFRQLCDDAQVPTVFLDARQIEPTPSAFLDALRGALGPGEHAAPLAALAAYPRVVLFLDTCETLAPLEGWLHESFLPQVPERALVVLASRTPPPLTWRSDAGWQRVARVLALRNLSPEESRVFLDSRGVPPAPHGPVRQFTPGHPLALSLVAELFRQRPGTRFQPEATPDIVKALLEQLVQKVPGPAHRAALEACALVRIMTEGLLAAMLNLPDAHEIFEWLRGLSFMESERQGLRPHDTTREVLAADLRWRNPDWYAELHRRARAYYVARLHQSQGQEQQRILLDFVYLHRDNLVVRPYYDWSTAGQVLADAPRADDWPTLLDMVAAHEGPESAALARHWLQRQPEGVLVVRGPDEGVAGFMASVALE
ncbi:MAG: AAA family ATPase, partial [Thermomicrobiaceae bacterium]|nr:AAA family ATPase [Thermomicrobiaceae bacterium]